MEMTALKPGTGSRPEEYCGANGLEQTGTKGISLVRQCAYLDNTYCGYLLEIFTLLAQGSTSILNFSSWSIP